MFKSQDYIYLGYDSKTDQFRYETTIVDDDFTEIVIAAASADAIRAVVRAAVLIDVYSRRNLNVAGNLALLMQYVENKLWMDIKQQIEEYQKFVPAYPKYHDQVMDYLIFM